MAAQAETDRAMEAEEMVEEVETVMAAPTEAEAETDQEVGMAVEAVMVAPADEEVLAERAAPTAGAMVRLGATDRLLRQPEVPVSIRMVFTKKPSVGKL